MRDQTEDEPKVSTDRAPVKVKERGTLCILYRPSASSGINAANWVDQGVVITIGSQFASSVRKMEKPGEYRLVRVLKTLTAKTGLIISENR